jgi:outer membrane receptor for ferrienterochelin and colicins
MKWFILSWASAILWSGGKRKLPIPNLRLCFKALIQGVTLLAATAAVAAQQPSASKSDTNLADLSLEELSNIEVASVYGASKYEQKVTQAPASVTIVTSDEIKKFGYRSLADIMRSIRGLYVANDRNYDVLGVRGFLRPGDYSSRILMLINGHRMNDNVYDSVYYGQDAVDINTIDRVEFIRGPSSSIYGNNAFFGVINIVTRSGQQFNGGVASVEAGSFNTYKAEFSYGKKFKNDIDAFVSGSYYTSDGQLWLYYPEFDQRISSDPRASHDGWSKHHDDEEVYKLFTSFGYHDFRLEGFFSRRKKYVPTASFGTIFDDGREQTIDTRAYVDLKYEHKFNPDNKLLARAFYDSYLYSGDYPYYPEPGVFANNKDDLHGDWAGTELQFDSTILDRHRLVVGAEYRENIRQNQLNYDDPSPGYYYMDDRRQSRIAAVFGQAEVSLLSNLTLNAGVRYDHYFQTFGGTVNPRVGLVYNPWSSGTFKLLYGQAFRAPNVYELYYNSEGSARGNPSLRPETIQTYEAVYEQYFARHYRFSLSGYYYHIADLISQQDDGDGVLYFDNVNHVQARGVEFELEAKYPNGWMARGSYALQRAEDEDTGGQLNNSPRHLAKFNLLAPLYKDKLYAGTEVQYHSQVKTLGGDEAADFTLVNFTLLSQNWIKGVKISASIYNLLDTKYGYPGAGDHLQDIITQDGRSFRIKVTYRF